MVLELGKLEIYPCQFLENLVRIGNISRDNPNHFWNALFSAFRPYRDLTYKEKMTYIKTERNRIASSIKMEDWLRYGDGFQSNHMIFDHFRNEFVNCCENEDGKPTAIIMRILQNKERFIDKIEVKDYNVEMKKWLLDEMSKRFNSRLDDTETHEKKKIPRDKRDKCTLLFRSYIDKLWKESTEKLFADFIEDVRDTESTIPFYFIPLILGYLNFHVFFVDAKGQDVLSINKHYLKKIMETKETCILVLCDSKTQIFEALGVIDPNEDDEDHKTVCLTRVFEMDDPIAQICYKRVVESH